MNERAKLQFAAWLKQSHPQIYKRAAKAADVAVAHRAEAATNALNARNANGLGQVTNGAAETEAKAGWFNTFLKSAATLGTTYLTIKNQQDQMDLNIERAQAGLPPLDIAQQPILTTQIQLPPETVSKITASAGMQVNKILMFGGLALAAFFLLR